MNISPVPLFHSDKFRCWLDWSYLMSPVLPRWREWRLFCYSDHPHTPWMDRSDTGIKYSSQATDLRDVVFVGRVGGHSNGPDLAPVRQLSELVLHTMGRYAWAEKNRAGRWMICRSWHNKCANSTVNAKPNDDTGFRRWDKACQVSDPVMTYMYVVKASYQLELTVHGHASANLCYYSYRCYSTTL